MSRVDAVPTWVRPPLRAVASTEEFLLWLYGRTRAPAALGAWSTLSWLAAADGDQTPGPLTRVGLPREVVAWAELRVATRISNGAPYPPATWWARHGIEQADRMTPDQWQVRVDSAGERHFVQGTAVALSWLLGEVDDPGLMAPSRDGDGARIPPEDVAQYEKVLRALSEPRTGRVAPAAKPA